ncbi:MAG: hypothetical protein NTX86_02785 [Candidatus Dependentiae bacterium]|nr:hypothetical protein [Candidatus Dependentiae bacterium]
MNYKSIFFSIALLPFTLSSYGNNVARILELKEMRFQKRLEIADISKRISESETIINSSGSLYQELFESVLEREKELFKQKNDIKKLDEKDVELITKEINASNDSFLKLFEQSIEQNKNIKQILIKGFFDEENPNEFGSFQSLRFLFVKVILERQFIEELVARYEDKIQELININQELEKLQQ